MKYYYGNSMKEALSNPPMEIKTTKQLRQYEENYSVVIPASEIDDEDDECDDDILCIYLVTFDIDNQNLQDEFDSRSSAFEYAKDNVENLPCVTKCWQSDLDTELGFGDDYEEEDITTEDPELAELLDEYI